MNQSGYRTGLFTSPHFVSPRERCCIDNIPISQNDFAQCLIDIQPAITYVLKQQDRWGRLSFLSCTPLLSIYYFAQQEVDWSVVEVGLGGRLDATNIVQLLNCQSLHQ